MYGNGRCVGKLTEREAHTVGFGVYDEPEVCKPTPHPSAFHATFPLGEPLKWRTGGAGAKKDCDLKSQSFL